MGTPKVERKWDRADQIIVPTALRLDAALMTNDLRIRRSGLAKII